MGMLSAEERKQVSAAVWRWAKEAPDVPVAGILGRHEKLTPKQIAQAIDNETREGKAFLEFLEHGVRREGVERVVERFTASTRRV